MKTCTLCKHELPFTAYYADSRRSDGRMSECKQCGKDRKNARRRTVLRAPPPLIPKRPRTNSGSGQYAGYTYRAQLMRERLQEIYGGKG